MGKQAGEVSRKTRAEHITLSADLSELCRDLQHADDVLREISKRRHDGEEDPSLVAHYAEVWSKHRRLKAQVLPMLLAELGVVP